jgi:hypothetical protein
MNIEDSLLKIPALIRKAENDLFEAVRRAKGSRMRSEHRSADLAMLILQAKDETGTKRFTNAEAREIELRRQLRKEPEYLALLREADEDEATASRIKSTIQYHRDVQANARAIMLGRSIASLIFDDVEVKL